MKSSNKGRVMKTEQKAKGRVRMVEKPGFYLGKYLKTEDNEEETPGSNHNSKESVQKAQILALLAKCIQVVSNDLVLLAHVPRSEADLQILADIHFMQQCNLFRTQQYSFLRLREIFEALGQMLAKFQKHMGEEKRHLYRQRPKEGKRPDDSSNCELTFQSEQTFSKFWFIVLRKKLYNNKHVRRVLQAVWIYLLRKNEGLFIEAIRLAAFGINPPYTSHQRFHMHELVFSENVDLARRIANQQTIFPIFAGPNQYQFSGMTPLVLAIRLKKYEMAGLLTELGADPQLRACTLDRRLSEGRKARNYTKSALDYGLTSLDQLRSVLHSFYGSRNIKLKELIEANAKAWQSLPEFALALDWEWTSHAEFLNKSLRDKVLVYKEGRNIVFRLKQLPVNGVYWQKGHFEVKIDVDAMEVMVRQQDDDWIPLRQYRRDLIEKEVQDIFRTKRLKTLPALERCEVQNVRAQIRNGVTYKKVTLRASYASEHVLEDQSSTLCFEDYKSFHKSASKNSIVDLQAIEQQGLLSYLRHYSPKPHSERLLETARSQKDSMIVVWLVNGWSVVSLFKPIVQLVCQYTGSNLIYEVISVLSEKEKGYTSMLPARIEVKFSSGFKLAIDFDVTGLKKLQALEVRSQTVIPVLDLLSFTEENDEELSQASKLFKDICNKEENELVNVLDESIELRKSISPNSKYASQLDKILNFKKKVRRDERDKQRKSKPKPRKADRQSRLNVSPQPRKEALRSKGKSKARGEEVSLRRSASPQVLQAVRMGTELGSVGPSRIQKKRR